MTHTESTPTTPADDVAERRALCLSPIVCPCGTAVYGTRRWGLVEVSTGDVHEHPVA